MTSLTFFDALLAGVDVLSRLSKLLNDGQYQTFQGGGASSIVQAAICGLGSTAIEFGYGSGTPDSLSTLITTLNEATRVYIMNGLPLYWTKLSLKELGSVGSTMSNFLLASLGQPPSQNYLQTVPYALSKLSSEVSSTHDLAVLLSQCARRKIPNTRPIGRVPIDITRILQADQFYARNNANGIFVANGSELMFTFHTALAGTESHIDIPQALQGITVVDPFVSVHEITAANTRRYQWDITGNQVSVNLARSTIKIDNARVTLTGIPDTIATNTMISLKGTFIKTGCEATQYDNLPSFRDLHPIMLKPLSSMLSQTRDVYIAMLMPRLLGTWYEFLTETSRRNGDVPYPLRDRTSQQYLDVDHMVEAMHVMEIGHNADITRSSFVEWYVGSLMLLIMASFNISYN